jgi:DNA-binding LacI/PurR family transcriptional regulator
MAVNIYDIAKKTGLSVVTVSRVLNNNPNVRESNRIKVENAIKELDYRPNAAARTLSSGKTAMISLVVPSLTDAFVIQVMSSVEKTLKENGMFMVVVSAANYDDFSESAYASLFLEGRVDGILVLTPICGNGYFFELKKRNVPFVLMDQHQVNLQVPTVTVDNFFGGYEATMHLMKSGAKKIAHISGADQFESSSERMRGYMEALRDGGMEADPDLVITGDFTVACGYRAVQNWMQKGILPDAVFAADDNTAFGVLNAAQHFGISVPRQLAVVGFDDHPYASMLYPKLSTVKQPTEEIGATGVQLLLDIINKNPRRNLKITLKPSLILRETTL